MSATLTTLANVLKTAYAPGLMNYVNNQSVMLGRLKKTIKRSSYQNNSVTWFYKSSNTQSTGAISEGAVLPVAGNATTQTLTEAAKYHYGVIGLTAQAIEMIEGGEAAAISGVQLELDGMRDQLAKDLTISIEYGDGTGALGKISTYVNPTVTMVPDTTLEGMGSLLIDDGMYIQSWSATSGGARTVNHQLVSANDISAGTFSLAAYGAGSGTDDEDSDFVFRSVTASVDPRSLCFRGLSYWVDDGGLAATVGGKARASYPELKAMSVNNSGTLRAVTESLVNDLLRKSWKQGGGKYATVLFSPMEIQQRMELTMRGDRTIPNYGTQLVAGNDGMSWRRPDGKIIPWVVSRYARSHRVLAIDEESLELRYMKDVTAENRDGAAWRTTDRTHAFEQWYYLWGNLLAMQCNGNGVLEDVSHTL